MSKPGGAGDRRFAAIYAAIREYDYRHAMALCERREVANTPLAKVCARGLDSREDDAYASWWRAHRAPCRRPTMPPPYASHVPLAHVQALKATVLQRSGHLDDARAIATALAREKPTDLAVLRALGSVFKATGDMGWFVQIFDVAAEQRPTDVPTLRQLCFAFVHVEDYAKMQKVRCLRAVAARTCVARLPVRAHAPASHSRAPCFLRDRLPSSSRRRRSAC